MQISTSAAQPRAAQRNAPTLSAPAAPPETEATDKVTLSWARQCASKLTPLLQEMHGTVKKNSVPLLAAAGLFAGIGCAIGCMTGHPGAGALKGIAFVGVAAFASELMDNRRFESKVLNWSKTMPGDPDTPRDLPDSFKNDALFYTNLGTNLGVACGIAVGVGTIVFGSPSIAIGTNLILGGAIGAALCTKPPTKP